MKNLIFWSLMTAPLLVACSQTRFSPGEDMTSNSTSMSEILENGDIRDTFLFNDNGGEAKVDVLFVDDNSESMASKQTKLGNALESFITGLGKVDWQIGITTTDTSTGAYGIQGSLIDFEGLGTPILTKKYPNYAQAFLDTVQRRETGSGDERPMRAIMQAIEKRNTDNAGFFRRGADLAVVLLTDEDEASNGNTTANKPDEVVDTFVKAFGGYNNLIVYGIMVSPNDKNCYEAEKNKGTKYANVLAELVDMTGGEIGSICDTDYGPTLDAIGQRVAQGVRTATLRYLPEPGTKLDVKIIPADSTLTWTLRGRVVVFNKPPNKGTKVQIVYEPD